MHCSGLTYTPGMYASTSELASLCDALAKEFPGAFYAPHHRSYGFQAIESYAEMLGLGETTGCPIRMFFSSNAFHSKSASHKKHWFERHLTSSKSRSHSCHSKLFGKQGQSPNPHRHD